MLKGKNSIFPTTNTDFYSHILPALKFIDIVFRFFFFHTVYSLRKLFYLYNIVDEFFTRILIFVLAFILVAILALRGKISIYQNR